MKFFKQLALLSSLFLFVGIQQAEASHFSSGEIYYRWSPIPSDSGRYEVFVNWYRNMGGIGITQNTQSLCVTSSCFNDITVNLNRVFPTGGQAQPGDPNAWRVRGLGACADSTPANLANGTFKNLSIHKFAGFVSIPGSCPDIRFTANAVCCRDVSDNLQGSPNMYLEARLNNTLGQSSSPEIITPAGKAFCLVQPGQTPFDFVQTAIDADGDSILYRFAQPQSGSQCGPGVNIAFRPGYTVNAPIPSSTGIVIDQVNGIFTLSPSQAGSYVLKVTAEDYRFDPVSLLWVNIGSSVREIQVPVTSICNQDSEAGPKIDVSATSSANLTNFTAAQIDSMEAFYNVQNFFSHDSLTNGANTVYQVAVFNGYQCFDSIVRFTTNTKVKCASADPTDFRLIGPDGVARPIVSVDTRCSVTLDTDTLHLHLFEPLDLDGTYFLQIRRGNDGNTLINECGYELAEFYSFLIPVTNCPKPTYDLDGVTVERDVDVRLDWSGNADLQDPSVIASFNSWNIYRADSGVRPMNLIKVINDANTRFFVDSFNQNGYFVDNFIYDYEVILVYNGKGRLPTRTCSTMQLRVDSAKRTESNLPIYWNHYNCIDQSVRNYDVFGAKRDTNLPDPGIASWNLITQTVDTSANISIPAASAATEGTYIARVVARNVNGNSRTDSSESNWIYYFITYTPPVPPVIPPVVGEVLIPNVITPNGDMINDRFFIQAPTDGGVQYEQISVSMFNRYGQRVFHDENFAVRNTETQGWEGVNNSGQKLTSGVYFYIIEMNNPSSGESQTLQGNLTINTGASK